MQRVSYGYTMIEVMIVLAVSTVLVVISLTFLSGADGRNGFSIAMRDVQSKFQDWINDVTSGFPGDTSGKTGLSDIECTNTGNKVMLKRTGGAVSESPGCIFLGKAVQITPQNLPHTSGQENHIYAYSIFGLRDDSSGALVQDIITSKPTPAVGFVGLGSVCGGGCPDMTEDYTLGHGAYVKSVSSTKIDATTGSAVSGGSSRLAGFYLTFNQLSANSNGSQDIKADLYKTDNTTNYRPGDQNTAIDNCISMIPATNICANPGVPNSNWPESMSEWDICFGNNANNQTAMLTLKSFSGIGATTSLKFEAC